MCFKIYKPSKEIYLSRTTGRGFSRALQMPNFKNKDLAVCRTFVVADLGERPGGPGPAPPPLFLNQTEARSRLRLVPPFFLRDSRASETRARVKITPREKRRHAEGREKIFSFPFARRPKAPKKNFFETPPPHPLSEGLDSPLVCHINPQFSGLTSHESPVA